MGLVRAQWLIADSKNVDSIFLCLSLKVWLVCVFYILKQYQLHVVTFGVDLESTNFSSNVKCFSKFEK